MQIAFTSSWTFLPGLLAWGFGIVLAVIMVRRGGGKAEKLLLAGCCLLFITGLARPLLTPWVLQSLRGSGMSNIDAARTIGWAVNIPLAAMTLAGLVCLARGFWQRFPRRRKAE